jgi:hypothetical protein
MTEKSEINRRRRLKNTWKEINLSTKNVGHSVSLFHMKIIV